MGIHDTIYDIITDMADRGYKEAVFIIDPYQFESIYSQDRMINRIDIHIKFLKEAQNDR